MSDYIKYFCFLLLFYDLCCGWQLFSFYSAAIRSNISLDGKWEIVIPVLKLIRVSLIAANVFLSILESASCDEVSLLIW